jgi:hypothetical protein
MSLEQLNSYLILPNIVAEPLVHLLRVRNVFPSILDLGTHYSYKFTQAEIRKGNVGITKLVLKQLRPVCREATADF